MKTLRVCIPERMIMGLVKLLLPFLIGVAAKLPLLPIVLVLVSGGDDVEDPALVTGHFFGT